VIEKSCCEIPVDLRSDTRRSSRRTRAAAPSRECGGCRHGAARPNCRIELLRFPSSVCSASRPAPVNRCGNPRQTSKWVHHAKRHTGILHAYRAAPDRLPIARAESNRRRRTRRPPDVAPQPPRGLPPFSLIVRIYVAVVADRIQPESCSVQANPFRRVGVPSTTCGPAWRLGENLRRSHHLMECRGELARARFARSSSSPAPRYRPRT